MNSLYRVHFLSVSSWKQPKPRSLARKVNDVKSTSAVAVMVMQLQLKESRLHQHSTKQVNEQNTDRQVNLSQASLLTSRH
jgi:hypothetical protein